VAACFGQEEWNEEKVLVVDTPGLGSMQACDGWASRLREKVDENGVTCATVILVMPTHYDRLNELLLKLVNVCRDTLGVSGLVVLWNDKYNVPEAEVTRKKDELQVSLEGQRIVVKGHLHCNSEMMPKR
jgi:hypothetical protein